MITQRGKCLTFLKIKANWRPEWIRLADTNQGLERDLFNQALWPCLSTDVKDSLGPQMDHSFREPSRV